MSAWYDAWLVTYNARLLDYAVYFTDWQTYVRGIDPTWANHIKYTNEKIVAMFEHVKSAVYHFDQTTEDAISTKEEVFDLWLERAAQMTF